MAKSSKRISVNQFESAATGENITTEILCGTDNVEIHIKRCLSLTEMLEFVQEVVSSCVDGETGEYTPEAYDFSIRVGVLTHYANFSMPTNLEKQYWLIYNTQAFNQVMEHIDDCQFNDIIRSIDRKIQFMLDVLSSSAVSKINEVVTKFGEIAQESENMFSEINPDEVKKVLQGIATLKNVDSESVARVVLENQTKDDADNTLGEV